MSLKEIRLRLSKIWHGLLKVVRELIVLGTNILNLSMYNPGNAEYQETNNERNIFQDALLL